MEIPPINLVVGNPAKIVKDVTDEMLAWKTEGTALYQALPQRLHASLHAVEPLRELSRDRRSQEQGYRTWGETRS